MVTAPLLMSLTLLTAVGQTTDLRGHQAGERLGATLVCGADLDHGGVASGPNGPFELLIGAPGWDAPGADDAGAVIWIPDLTALMGEPGGYVYLDQAHVPTAYASVFAGERFGAGLDYGDVNDDGRSEVFIGAPGHNWTDVPNLGGLGRAYLLPGGGTAASWAEDPANHAPLILEIGETLGPVVAGLGAGVALYDADGDGHADLLALAPVLPMDQLAANPTSLGTGFAGWIDGDDLDLLAPTTMLDLREVPHGFVAGDGDTAGHLDRIHRMGAVDAGAGHELALVDLDPPLSDDDPGAVYLFFTGTTAYPSLTYATDGWIALVPETGGDQLGQAIAFGDVTGDDEPDLLVGAPGWRGRGALAIFPGPLGDDPVLELATDAIVLEGSAEGSQLGWALVPADIDGDGIDDVVIGAPAWEAEGEQTPGEVLMVFGGPALALEPGTVVPVDNLVRYSWDGEPHDGLGAALCSVGDVDGDGLIDLAVSAPDATPAAGLDGAGRVWLALSSAVPDADGDGVSAVYDCDDQDPAVFPARPDDPDNYPAAPEICDGKDDDCDGALHALEVDADGDGWMVCQADCNDDPGADGALAQLDDVDGDGYNTCGVSPGAIPADADLENVQPQQSNPDLIDCDDADPEVFPNNPDPDECDDRDNDCDGTIDEDGEQDHYLDLDHDGYGDMEGEAHHVCWSADYAERSGDCNDLDPEIHPGAEDLPNDGIDQDCDGRDFQGGQPCLCTASGHPAAGIVSLLGLLLGVLWLGISCRSR